MDQFYSPRLPASATDLNKLGKEQVFRRIADASLRMARKSQDVQELTMQLFVEFACGYRASTRRPTVSECYRDLVCAVIEACGTLSCLPSERSFRRCVTREAELVARTFVASGRSPR